MIRKIERLFCRDELVDIAGIVSKERDTVVAKWTLLSNKGRPNDSKGPDYFIITSPVISDDEDRKTVPFLYR